MRASFAAANSRIPASKSSLARKPSSVAARSGEAKTWRTSPARHCPVTTGGSAGSTARASAAAMSPHGARRAAGDVERARDAGLQREHVGRGDVAHVHEVAPLARRPRTRAARCPAASDGAEDARHAGVGRVARHPRTVDVVVAQRGDGRAGLAGERGAQVLLRDLGRGVDVARVERRVLGHRLGRQRAAAARARRLEAARRRGPPACAGRAGRARAPRSGSGPRRRRPCSRRARARPAKRAGGERAQQHARCRGRCGRRSRRCRRGRRRARPSPPGG